MTGVEGYNTEKAEAIDIINNLIKGTKSYIPTPTERGDMIEAEMTAEGQQPSELIKKVKQQQTGIIKTVCSKIIEGFYKEFGIDKEVDEEIINRATSETLSKTDGVMEFLACLDYLGLKSDIKISHSALADITLEIANPTYSIGKDILLILFSVISQEKNNIGKSHYLVSKCLDLCVPF